MKLIVLVAILALIIPTLSFRISAAEVSADSPTPQELAGHVITALRTGKINEVKSHLLADLEVLNKGAKDFPKDPLVHFALAICYMTQGNIAATIPNMKIAYDNSNKNIAIGTMYALALKMDKQPLKAYELDKEILKLHPGVPQLQMSMAAMDMTIQKYDEASSIIRDIQREARGKLAEADTLHALM